MAYTVKLDSFFRQAKKETVLAGRKLTFMAHVD